MEAPQAGCGKFFAVLLRFSVSGKVLFALVSLSAAREREDGGRAGVSPMVTAAFAWDLMPAVGRVVPHWALRRSCLECLMLESS